MEVDTSGKLLISHPKTLDASPIELPHGRHQTRSAR